jgi:hypothetical protein
LLNDDNRTLNIASDTHPNPSIPTRTLPESSLQDRSKARHLVCTCLTMNADRWDRISYDSNCLLSSACKPPSFAVSIVTRNNVYNNGTIINTFAVFFGAVFVSVAYCLVLRTLIFGMHFSHTW